VSPDGRWLAYSSAESGRYDVYLERLPADGRRYKVSPQGGLEPLCRSASRLVFRSGFTWYEVAVDLLAPRPAGEPREIFSDTRFIDTSGRSNVLTPDGSVIYVRGTAQTTGNFIRVIPRWTDQMRRRVRQGQ
jgi:hypothetical protein